MLKFSIFRIPVTVHWMFLLLAAFLGGGLRAQTANQLWDVAIFIFAAFISILVHELGHALVGLKMGAPRTEIQLHGMGGLARFPGARFTRKQNILTTIAGPAASLGLAFLFLALAILLSNLRISLDPSFARFISIMVTINLFWSIINLCPVMPLDGGQILRSALGPNRAVTSSVIGLITLVCLAVALWLFTESLYNMIIMAFLGVHTWKLLQLDIQNTKNAS